MRNGVWTEDVVVEINGNFLKRSGIRMGEWRFTDDLRANGLLRTDLGLPEGSSGCLVKA